MLLPVLDQSRLGQRLPEYRVWTALCMALGIQSYVELGSGAAHVLKEAGVPKVVSVDIAHSTERHNPYEAEGVLYLRGDSHSPYTLQAVIGLLGGWPDAVFVDAAHDYESACRDYELWWPMTKLVMGFHDILIDDVDRLWRQVSLPTASVKIIGCDVPSAVSWQGQGGAPSNGVLSAGGIGVLFK